MRREVALGLVFAVALAGAAIVNAPRVDAGSGKRDLSLEEQLRKETSKVYLKRVKRLEPIAQWCIAQQLLPQARETIADMEKLASDWKGLDELKTKAEGITEPSTSASDVQSYHNRRKSADEDYAKELMALAKKCFGVQLFARAFDLIGEVLVANPDHAEARKLRHYVKKDGKWLTTYEAMMMKDNVLYTDKAGVVQGWVPKKDVAQWDKGLRPYGGKFVPEEEEVAHCSGKENHQWIVESEHFEIRTKTSRAEAYEFAQLLEGYYDAFFRVFISFYDLKEGAELLFDVTPSKKKHVVLYFKDRNAYLNHCKQEHGNGAVILDSAGFYTQGGEACSHTSHFYKTELSSEVLSTTYHEVTHQLFAETKEEKSGSVGNNWIPEGIASYIETWGKDESGRWVPGMDKHHNRLVAAKKFLTDHPEWKLSDFITIGYDDFHKEPGRGMNYCLSEAISYFLMQYDDERYREDFVKLISLYYAGKAKDGSLFDFIQVAGPESGRTATLEKQFKEYMGTLGDE